MILTEDGDLKRKGETESKIKRVGKREIARFSIKG